MWFPRACKNVKLHLTKILSYFILLEQCFAWRVSKLYWVSMILVVYFRIEIEFCTKWRLQLNLIQNARVTRQHCHEACNNEIFHWNTSTISVEQHASVGFHSLAVGEWLMKCFFRQFWQHVSIWQTLIFFGEKIEKKTFSSVTFRPT